MSDFKPWVQSFGRSFIVVLTYLSVLTLGFVIDSPILWPFVWGICGFVLSGFFSALHYCSHGTLYPQSRLNRVLGCVWSLPLLMNFSMYRYFHLEHHKNTSAPGDTEPIGELSLIRYVLFALNWDFIFGFLRLSFASLFGYFPVFVRSQYVKSSVRIDAVMLSLFICAMIFATLLHTKFLLYVYWIPLQIALICNFVITLGEHYGCDATRDVSCNTRTFDVKNRIFKFFYWNSNYHAEHHYFPNARLWELPQIHLELRDQLQYLETSYLNFTWNILRSLPIFLKNKTPIPIDRHKNFLFPLSK